MRIDLHCHSTHSDGSVPPEQVADMARNFGVELFCLTDHDTMAGFEATRAALPDATVLRGLELSCAHVGRTVHVLVYGVEEGGGREALQARLDRVNVDRRSRLCQIVAKLGKLGVALNENELLARIEGRTPGRPHIAQALVELGAVSSLREAFDRYLHDGGPADVEIERVALEEGLSLGRAAGAKMSLAHPHTLRDHGVVAEIFRTFRRSGLEGIEAWYGGYGTRQREPWIRLARAQDLVVTGGSDFHGDATPEIARPGLELPEPQAAPLREWLGLRADTPTA